MLNLNEEEAKKLFHTTGCVTALETMISDESGLAIGIAAGVIVALCTATTIACFVAQNFGKKDRLEEFGMTYY